MCKDCLIEVRPEQGRICRDNGADLLNFKGCVQCQKLTILKRVDVDNSDDDLEEDEEEIHYHHVCSVCEHVVAQHFYSYSVDDNTQEYNMDCFLCGRGARVTTFSTDFAVHEKDYQQNDPDGAYLLLSPPPERPAIEKVDILIDSDKLAQYTSAKQTTDEDSADWS